VADLEAFYDFRGRTVVAVGAGGGQLVEYLRHAGEVIAVDRDREALERLEGRLAERGLARRSRLVAKELLDFHIPGDVVVFEFCLHLMDEPERALAHARGLAPDVVVIDHAPGSRWSWYAAEDPGVEACWKAVQRAGIRTQTTAEAYQRFSNYAALKAKLASQGPQSRERVVAFRRQRAIMIPMPYRLALLPRLGSAAGAPAAD
jgi:SAM-dependent methyltransferase